MDEDLGGSHNMIRVVRDVADEHVEDSEAKHAVSRRRDPQSMDDAAAAGVARERLLILATEDFHRVRKVHHRRRLDPR